MLGRLSPIYLYTSHFRVQPFVSVAAQRPRFVPNPAEVAALLEERANVEALIQKIEKLEDGRSDRKG